MTPAKMVSGSTVTPRNRVHDPRQVALVGIVYFPHLERPRPMHHIQHREISSGQWYRDTDEGPFPDPLPALERRDEIRSEWQNDGIQRGCRAVDDAGNVLEYQTREI